MKRNLSALLILAFVFSGQPSLPGKAQERAIESKNSYAENKAIKDSLFEVAFDNQYFITKHIQSRTKVRVVEKPVIRFIKVYRTIPIYVPVGDSAAYKESLKTDTLPGKYYFKDTSPKKSWLYRIFHKKKK